MNAEGTLSRLRRSAGKSFNEWIYLMIGKILGAAIGRKLAGRNEEGKGTLIGFVAPAIARRVTPAIALTVGAVWGVKKLRNRRRARAA
ncbi:MAG: hypothetical protein JO013_01945 [Alphaproteobacteria bacterium]|nr:hypothetical protein [Alphaproteobacteria bacterium]